MNCCKFSRDGRTVATGDDQGEIILWTMAAEEPERVFGEEVTARERWVRLATLRGHVQDVLDIAWSADGSRLISASVDNAVKVWDIRNTSKAPVTLRNHANFVQGVAIDPFGRLLASMGNDRALRIFTANATTWIQIAAMSSLSSLIDTDGNVVSGDTRLFVDDTRFKTFFRRLAWSPDGSILACPSGVCFPEKKKFAVHIFARNEWTKPVLQCGGLDKPPVAVKFSSVLYELRTNITKAPNAPFAKFTYRMILAVACVDSVMFYDTQSMSRPFAMVDGLHCAEITDLSWSSDGLSVAISSMDGYVSLVCFTPEELGEKLAPENTPQWLNHREELEQPPFLMKSPVRSRITTVIPRTKGTVSPPIPVQPRPKTIPPSDDVAMGETSPPVDGTSRCTIPTSGEVGRVRRIYPKLMPDLPIRTAPTPGKSMVSLAASEQAVSVARAASGGFRISLSKPANDTNLVTIPDDMLQKSESEAAEAVKQAVSDMIKMESGGEESMDVSQEPIVDEKDVPVVQEIVDIVTSEEAKQKVHPEEQLVEAAQDVVLAMPAPAQAMLMVVGEVQLPPTPLDPPTACQSLHASHGDSKNISADPRSPVKAKPAQQSIPSTAIAETQTNPVQITTSPAKEQSKKLPVLEKTIATVRRSSAGFGQGRCKAKKVQTTLFSFTNPQARTERPMQRQNVLQTRQVSSDKEALPDQDSAAPRLPNAAITKLPKKNAAPPTTEGGEIVHGGEAKRRKTKQANVIDLT